MPFYCNHDKDTELLDVFIRGLPDEAKNALSLTLFKYCPKCQRFFRLVPKELDSAETIEG